MILNLILFDLMLTFSYIFYRFLSKKFHLRVKSKNIKKHCFDILELIFYGSIVYFLYNKRFFDNQYFMIYIISLISFGFVLEVPGVDKTVPNFKLWNLNKMIAIVILIIITFYCGKNNIINKRNLIITSFSSSIFVYYLIRSYYKNNFKTFHPHHWQIFWYLSLLFVPICFKTKFLSAMYLAFFSHGIIAHSAASILKDD